RGRRDDQVHVHALRATAASRSAGALTAVGRHNGRMKCDVLIVGGGTGGTAAAIALADKGLSVILTEETDWLGGQLTSQLVPPDEHPWIESFGCTARYRDRRQRWRTKFIHGWESDTRRVRPEALKNTRLNPGGGW